MNKGNRRGGGKNPDTYDKNSREWQDRERFARELSRHQRKRKIRILTVILIVIAIAGYWFLYRSTRPYSYAKESWSQEIATSTNQSYVAFSDGILQYSSNGATFYNTTSKTVWTVSFEMKNPAVTVQDEYALIYDQGYQTAVILEAQTGTCGTILTELSITKATVSAYGVAALLVEEDLANDILFFDKQGSQLDIQVRTLMSESGYPMDISFSPDGQMMIVSFAYVDSGVMQSRIVFYSFDTTLNTSTHAVAAFQKYDDTIFADVEFLDDDRAVAFGDECIVLYSLDSESTPEELAVIEIEEEITNLSYSYDSGNIAFATTDGDLVQSRLLYLYSVDGDLLFDTQTNFEFSTMYLGEKGLYLIATSTMQYLNLGGDVCFTGSLDCNILHMVSVQGATDFLVISDQALKYIKLVRE